MYAAALWMVWVASQQTDAMGLASVFAGLLLTGFAAWAYGASQVRGGSRLLNGAALASVAGLCALLAGLGLSRPALAASGPSADGSEPFSSARLAALLAAHRPVFVDMTASWCVTCLVNERIALSPQAVRQSFASHDVAYLKGDWTRQDAGITAFLRAHDRSGVPLYVYFSADGSMQELPQLLTPGLVLAAIDRG
jgi:thiol:disulfide interchange protein DsbD